MGRWVEAFRTWPQYGNPVRGLLKLDENITSPWIVCYPAIHLASGSFPSTWMPSTVAGFKPSHWMPMPKPPVKRPR